MALDSPADVIWQPDNVTADMTPPYSFEKYFLDLYKNRGAQCRQNGKKYVVHLDGKLAGLKELIAEAQIDVIDSFSLSEMSGDVPVGVAISLWPNTAICPNFPASLAERSSTEIKAYLDQIDRQFAESPYMFQVSEDIPLAAYPNLLPVLSGFYSS